MKGQTKRKLISGAIQVVIGIGALIFGLISKGTAYAYTKYMGILLLLSGGFTLVTSGLRAFLDKKEADKIAKVELAKQKNTTENASEKVAEATPENSQQSIQDTTKK